MRPPSPAARRATRWPSRLRTRSTVASARRRCPAVGSSTTASTGCCPSPSRGKGRAWSPGSRSRSGRSSRTSRSKRPLRSARGASRPGARRTPLRRRRPSWSEGPASAYGALRAGVAEPTLPGDGLQDHALSLLRDGRGGPGVLAQARAHARPHACAYVSAGVRVCVRAPRRGIAGGGWRLFVRERIRRFLGGGKEVAHVHARSLARTRDRRLPCRRARLAPPASPRGAACMSSGPPAVHDNSTLVGTLIGSFPSSSLPLASLS
mmetsp:Transcript_81804/g.253867  ORF Transcript_81804/g.253867 Transcript_81804/m.253867 type:complete len:264 (-) Transcript_81804:160-951(-)